MNSRVHSDLYASADYLDYQDYIQSLTEIITSSDSPLTIGIFGGWGSGKTSLMHMIRLSLDRVDPKHQQYKSIWFNSWKYRKDDVLWRSLILQVLQEIKETFQMEDDAKDVLRDISRLEESLYHDVNWEEFGKIQVDWGKIASGTLKAATTMFFVLSPWASLPLKAIEAAQETIGKGETTGSLADLFDSFQRESRQQMLVRNQYFEQFENLFSKIVKKYVISKKGKLVIFIDDLDRCPPESVVDILESIKLFLDVQGCIFVIGADPDVISSGIEDKYKHLNASQSHRITGHNYLEKIIQVPFKLPPLESQQIRKYIKRVDPSFSDYATGILSIGIEKNPRKVKRAINLYKLIDSIIAKRKSSGKLNFEINDQDLAKMVVLLSRYDRLFSLIAQDPSSIKDLETFFTKKTAITLKENFLSEISSLDNSEIVDLRAVLTEQPEVSSFSRLEDKQIEQLIFMTNSVVGITGEIGNLSSERLDLSGLLEGGLDSIQKRIAKLDVQHRKGYGKTIWNLLHSTMPAHERILYGQVLHMLGYISDISNYILIPSGPFLAGIEKKEVNIDSFSISQYPVTNNQYSEFVVERGYERPEFWSIDGWRIKNEMNWSKPSLWDNEQFNQGFHPVVGISWYEASAFAKWAKKRLPTQLEWEKAMRGSDGRVFTWGSDVILGNANTADEKIFCTTPVGIYPNSGSPYDLHDGIGNVWEWTKSSPNPNMYLLCGGAWDSLINSISCWSTVEDRATGRYNNQGFRLVTD